MTYYYKTVKRPKQALTFGVPNNHKIFVFGVIWGVYGKFGVIWIWSIETLRKFVII